MFEIIKRYCLNCFYCFIVLYGIASCSKDDAYKKYIKNGEVKYPAKPDTLIASSGMHRIQLAFVIPDPNITKVEIYWNNKGSKIELPVTTGRVLKDTIKTIIENLEEGSYTFNMFTRDEDNNVSVMTEVQGTAYGVNYTNSLVNRGIKKSGTIAGTDGITTIEWYNPEENENGVELRYTSTAGNEKAVFIAKSETKTVIADYQPGSEFRYRTFFIPDSNIIDTFAAAYLTMPAPAITYPDLDKSKFREYILPTDAPSAYGWLLSYLWDNQVAEGRGFHTPITISSPHHFTFDLGVTAQLSEFRIWQRSGVYYYGYGNPKKWEVWGSTNPAPDGSFNGWTKLMDCQSVKPSGPGPVTQADIDFAAAGELFKFSSLTQPVRYIRFKMLENWSNNSTPASGASIHIMEVNFKGSF